MFFKHSNRIFSIPSSALSVAAMLSFMPSFAQTATEPAPAPEAAAPEAAEPAPVEVKVEKKTPNETKVNLRGQVDLGTRDFNKKSGSKQPRLEKLRLKVERKQGDVSAFGEFNLHELERLADSTTTTLTTLDPNDTNPDPTKRKTVTTSVASPSKQTRFIRRYEFTYKTPIDLKITWGRNDVPKLQGYIDQAGADFAAKGASTTATGFGNTVEGWRFNYESEEGQPFKLQYWLARDNTFQSNQSLWDAANPDVRPTEDSRGNRTWFHHIQGQTSFGSTELTLGAGLQSQILKSKATDDTKSVGKLNSNIFLQAESAVTSDVKVKVGAQMDSDAVRTSTNKADAVKVTTLVLATKIVVVPKSVTLLADISHRTVKWPEKAVDDFKTTEVDLKDKLADLAVTVGADLAIAESLSLVPSVGYYSNSLSASNIVKSDKDLYNAAKRTPLKNKDGKTTKSQTVAGIALKLNY